MQQLGERWCSFTCEQAISRGNRDGVRPSARGRGLGTELLRQSLLRARDIGLDKALLTCGKTNYASVKVILSNGGVLESEEFLPDRAEVVQRYSIQIPLRPF